jgi:zinc protease
MFVRSYRLLILGLLLLSGSVMASDAKIFDLPYLSRELPNGLRVIVVRTDYPDLVTLQIPVQTGSRNEVEPGKSGFAHFFEHMMFRGTAKYPADRYEAIINSVGGAQNAYTSDDLTNYHVTFTKADLEKVLEVEADRFMNLEYSEAQFRTEALAVKGEYLKNYSNPFQKISEVTRNAAFTTHPYKHTTIGFFEDIQAMPEQLEYSKLFFDRWYRPEKTSVIVVGDVNPEAAFKLVEKYFAPWQRGSYTVDIPVEPPPSGPQQQHIRWEAPTQAYFTLSFRGPAFRATERELPALDLLGEVWFSQTSDLYQKLVVKERLVDQLFFGAANRKDPGLIQIAARLIKPENAAVVSAAILETLVRARTEQVTPDKLQDIKSALKYSFAASLDNSEAIGAMLARFVHYERDPETVNRLYQTYDALTAEDLQAAANRYLVDRSRVLVTLANTEALAGGTFASIDERVAAVARAAAPSFAVEELKGDSPLVAVNLLFATGAAADPAGKKGLAQLTAAMITDGGSQARSYREITDSLYPLAASFDAQVDKEMLSFQGLVHRDNLAKWSALTLEQLLSPGFKDEDFQRVKTSLINAIRTNLRGNDDEELGKEVLYQFIYGPAHPYGTLNLGDVSDLERMTLDDVRAFYNEQLTQANLTLGLAGGYSDTWAGDFKRALTRLPAGTKRTFTLPTPPAIEGREALIVQKETSSVAVSMGIPVEVKRGDKDWLALWLARSWLGEHRQGGQLFQRIREQRGMNYGDYAYIEYFPRGGSRFFPDTNLGRQQQIFQVWIRPLRDNNDAVFATRVALFELDALIKDGMTAAEFQAQRDYLLKFVAQLAKTQSQRLGYALDSRYYRMGDFASYARSGLAKLSLADVNRAIRKHLQTRNAKFVFVTKDSADLTRRLTSDAPSPIKYPTAKPELAAEDKIIEKLPLKFVPAKVRTLSAAEVFE